MKNRLAQYFGNRLSALRRDEGFVVMSTLAIFLFIFILCAFVYAVGETIHQRIKIQNACDAAAYSAAVVQADGLSRMAVVNRAMSWSYVQMTNRQMDYITYRWLKLTCKHFQEDKDNAEKYNANLVLAADKELGYWALLEAAVSGAISIIFDLDCSGRNGTSKKIVHVAHGEEGHGWWCGLDVEDRKGHVIRLNHPKNEKFVNAVVTSALETVTDMLTTHENIQKVVSLFGFIDSDDSPDGWGERLGKLIDYDKFNINNLNNALPRINNQMTASMRMTAESILKSMLVDSRLDVSDALKDYYISIHIPEGVDPYQDVEQRSAAPKSFFSPLHNTEAEEMLFLNMATAKSASKSLPDHFPILGPDGLACGLDQWFIRGKGLYSDGEDHSCDSHPLSVSFAESPDFHQATMIRDEGMLGIQRIYKDSNLNENGAGFLATERMKQVGVHPAQYIRHSSNFSALPQCCKDACERFHNGSTNEYWIAEHPVYAKVPDEKKAVWRGNHLIDFLNITNNLTNVAKGFLSNNSVSINDNMSQKGAVEDRLKEIHDSQLPPGSNDPYTSPLDKEKDKGTTGFFKDEGNQEKMNAGGADPSLVESGVGKIANAISNVLGNMLGNFLDIHPSCENEPKLDYAKYPMCETIKDPTSALYSEYRWGSGKWICATKGLTYLLCLAFDHPYIYCDYPSGELEIDFGLVSFDIDVDGYLHLGWPKWFCGNEPSGFHVIPPLIPRSISGRHGYMKNNMTDLLTGGFIRPMKPLWGNEKDRTFSRQEYECCAMFFDGITDCAVPIMGLVTWPGLIRGHARIYGDDKEIYNNRYVGAKCKPWVLNERFFAGDGTIVIGAAMKHTNPLVQLMNFWNSNAGTQADTDTTVLSAFNIPQGNYMWTMSAARAGVRHTRRNGEFDQERQYQITYDSTSDPENLLYGSSYVFSQKDDSGDKGSWVHPVTWGGTHDDNPNSLSRYYNPSKKQTEVPIWNGCPCGRNAIQFRNLWNLCETDWDATLIPLRYAGQKAVLYTGGDSSDEKGKGQPFNELSYSERSEFAGNADNNNKVGKGENWVWSSPSLTDNPFVMNGWKPAKTSFFADLAYENLPGPLTTLYSTLKKDGLNLNSNVPTGKKEQTIDVFTILKDRIL